jgi:hypothetical protein
MTSPSSLQSNWNASPHSKMLGLRIQVHLEIADSVAAVR